MRLHTLMLVALSNIVLRTEQRRAKAWSWVNLTLFALSARIWIPRWLRWRIERIGRACLRRSVRIHHRRALRHVAIAQRELRERALPPVLRPSEPGVYRVLPAPERRAPPAALPLPGPPRRVSE
jgi:hypothetical protein